MNNTQEYSTIVRLNATEARNQLDALTKRYNDLRKARDKALVEGKDTKFVKELNKELKQAAAELRSYETNVKATIDTLNNLSEATVGEIEKAIRAIKKEMKQVSDPAEYKKLNQHLESLKGRLADIKGEVRETEPLLERINNGFNKWQGSILAAAGAITGLTMTIRSAVQAFADMEEAEADVQKYTGMSKEQVQALNEELKKIDTRTSREDLNALAGAAGRLGISSQEGVLEFIDAADKIGVALGDDLGDGAIDKVGKLAMAFGEDDRMGLRGAMLATGSAMNELAANSSANAGYLVGFSSRLAGVATTANMTQAGIMGLGAVLDENLLQSEMSATAIMQVLVAMQKDSGKFAKVAGKDMKEFSDLVKTDVNAALLEFLEGLGRLGDAENVANALDELSLDGARMTGVLMALSNKTEDIVRLQDLANEAYSEGSSVLNEFNTMNNTVQANLDKAKKRFQEVVIELGEKLQPVVAYTVSGFSLLVKTLSAIVTVISENIKIIAVLTTTIAAYTLAVNAASIATNIHYGYLVLTDNIIPKVIAKTRALWAALLSNPYAAIVAAITAAITSLIAWGAQTEKAAKTMNEEARAAKRAADAKEYLKEVTEKATGTHDKEIARLKLLNSVAHDNSMTLEQRRKALEEIQKIVPAYNASLTKEGKLLNDNTAALDAYINGLMREAIIKAYMDDLASMYKELGSMKTKRANMNKELSEASKTIQYSGSHIDYSPTGVPWASSDPNVNNALNKSKGLKMGISLLDEDIKALQAKIDEVDNAMKESIKLGEADIRQIGGGGSSGAGKSSGKKTTQKGGSGGSDNKNDDPFRDQRKKEIAELKQNYKEKYQLAEQNKYDRILTEEQYLEEVNKLRVLELSETLAILKKTKASEEEIAQAEYAVKNELNNQIIEKKKQRYNLENKLAEENRKQQEKKEAELKKNKSELLKKFLDEDVEETKESYRKMAKELLDAGKLTEEQFAKISKKIEDIGKETKEVSTNGLDWFSAGIIETAKAVDTLTKKIADGKQSWEDYAAVGMAAVSTIMNGLSSLGDYYRASADADVKREEEKYDRMIDAAGKNRKQTEKLEKEKQTAIAKIKNEANDKQMKIQVAQAIAQGAQAAINAYSSAAAIPVVGYTIAPIAAAAAVAATALQIATIKKQAEAQRETGYYTGGFTGGSNYRREAGVVHEGEFVANHHAVNNRQILPALQLIDQAQRNNTIGSLTAADVSAAMGQKGANVASNISDNKELAAAIVSMNVVVARLNAELEKGIDAKVYTEGEYGIARSMEWHNKIYGGL